MNSKETFDDQSDIIHEHVLEIVINLYYYLFSFYHAQLLFSHKFKFIQDITCIIFAKIFKGKKMNGRKVKFNVKSRFVLATSFTFYCMM